MAKDVYMPVLGMNQETGILLHWLKQEGDEVTKGEPLMEIATDKTDVEIEAPASGILRRVSAREGDEVPVGQVIAVIAGVDEELEPSTRPSNASNALAPTRSEDTQGEQRALRGSDSVVLASPVAMRAAAEYGVDLGQVTPSSGSRISKEDVLAYVDSQSQRMAKADATGQTTGQSTEQATEQVTERVPASPKARRLAAESGLDLAQLQPSGPAGAVVAGDVLQAATAAMVAGIEPPVAMEQPLQPAAEEREIIPMSRMWRVMVERLSESWTTAPHFYLAREVDATNLVAWYEGVSSRSSSIITYTDLLVKVVASALRIHARLNARWEKGEIVQNQPVHIGLAVAVPDGLLVPVVHNADRLRLYEIAERRQSLVEASKKGALKPVDLQGGTFTISNLGMYGVDSFNAIVNPPQAAILAVGKIGDRVVAEDGQAVVKPMMSCTLSCDHRVVDGARAADFLRTLAQFCAEPLRLLE